MHVYANDICLDRLDKAGKKLKLTFPMVTKGAMHSVTAAIAAKASGAESSGSSELPLPPPPPPAGAAPEQEPSSSSTGLTHAKQEVVSIIEESMQAHISKKLQEIEKRQ